MAAPRSTRQLRGELDALMDQMLSLPVDDSAPRTATMDPPPEPRHDLGSPTPSRVPDAAFGPSAGRDDDASRGAGGDAGCGSLGRYSRDRGADGTGGSKPRRSSGHRTAAGTQHGVPAVEPEPAPPAAVKESFWVGKPDLVPDPSPKLPRFRRVVRASRSRPRRDPSRPHRSADRAAAEPADLAAVRFRSPYASDDRPPNLRPRRRRSGDSERSLRHDPRHPRHPDAAGRGRLAPQGSGPLDLGTEPPRRMHRFTPATWHFRIAQDAGVRGEYQGAPSYAGWVSRPVPTARLQRFPSCREARSRGRVRRPILQGDLMNDDAESQPTSIIAGVLQPTSCPAWDRSSRAG